jgi:glycolate oxidase iron-sulfur subunit
MTDAFAAPAAPESLLADVDRLVADCVHCGFCLDSCPTYVLWANEADSPRGRIVLIDEAAKADGRVSGEIADHIDSCLGCLACVSACPSGVRYDELIERARPEVERQRVRPRGQRLLRRTLFETLPHPDRLRALAPAIAVGKRAAAALPASLAPLARVAPVAPTREQLRWRAPALTPAIGPVRGRVALLLGCVQRIFFTDVHRATIAVLAAEGWEVLAPSAPDCCGALELHAGELERGSARAQQTIEALGALDVDHVVVNAAGCGAAMKRYGELLGDDRARDFSARVRDVSEILAAAPRRSRLGPLPLRVVYHDACHLRHAQRLTEAPRALLAEIPELDLLEVGLEPEVCCGSAGIYNLVAPEPAAALGERKARNLIATGADTVAAANPGCAAQLALHLGELGRPLPVHHPIELLWRSMQAADSAR